jgi:hypothetical protein
MNLECASNSQTKKLQMQSIQLLQALFKRKANESPQKKKKKEKE